MKRIPGVTVWQESGPSAAALTGLGYGLQRKLVVTPEDYGAYGVDDTTYIMNAANAAAEEGRTLLFTQIYPVLTDGGLTPPEGARWRFEGGGWIVGSAATGDTLVRILYSDIILENPQLDGGGHADSVTDPLNVPGVNHLIRFFDTEGPVSGTRIRRPKLRRSQVSGIWMAESDANGFSDTEIDHPEFEDTLYGFSCTNMQNSRDTNILVPRMSRGTSELTSRTMCNLDRYARGVQVLGGYGNSRRFAVAMASARSCYAIGVYAYGQDDPERGASGFHLEPTHEVDDCYDCHFDGCVSEAAANNGYEATYNDDYPERMYDCSWTNNTSIDAGKQGYYISAGVIGYNYAGNKERGSGRNGHALLGDRGKIYGPRSENAGRNGILLGGTGSEMFGFHAHNPGQGSSGSEEVDEDGNPIPDSASGVYAGLRLIGTNPKVHGGYVTRDAGVTYPTAVRAASSATGIEIRGLEYDYAGQSGITVGTEFSIFEAVNRSNGQRTFQYPNITVTHNGLLTFGAANARDVGWNRQAAALIGLMTGVQLDVAGTFTQPLRMGAYRLWVNASSGKLYIKSGAPSSDTDGTIVGTQT